MPISTQIVLQPPTKNSQLSLIGNLMDSSRKKVSEAVEYASGASIYSPEDMIPELTTAQTSVLTLFYGLLFGDLNLCKAVLEIQVPQLKSTFLRTWLADDFSFRHHDVSKVLFLLSYLVDRKILSIPENILRIFGGLFEKYGLAESCPKEMLHVFNVGQKAAEDRTFTFRWFQTRKNTRKTKYVDEDEELVIVTEEDCMPDSNFPEKDDNTSLCSGNIAKSKFSYRSRKNLSGKNTSKKSISQKALQKSIFVDSDGRNDVHRLARFGMTKELHDKIEEDLNIIFAVDNSGRTLLHCAVESGNFFTVELLLIAGANVNARTANGKTPLDFAYIEHGIMSDIWKILLEYGATI